MKKIQAGCKSASDSWIICELIDPRRALRDFGWTLTQDYVAWKKADEDDEWRVELFVDTDRTGFLSS